ncbi:MAG TPA: choice-of-anchor D domain-containing protein, partial [Kofleriaceae bacterium]|nr:choice-of-anchor D domain-containing protein [Kofleriaceae bacterium]
MRPLVALVLVAGTAHAGTGSVVATPPVTFIVTGSGTGTAIATLHNTSSGAFQVKLARDASCDADIDFSITGGNPFTLPGTSTKPITFACTNTKLGIERCTVHAIDANTGEPLADLAGACEHVNATSLSATTPMLAFGSVTVGDTVALPLVLTNNGSSPIGKLFFETDDLDDNFEIALPCNPDAPACDGNIVPLAPGASTNVVVHCLPRTSGAHTAHLEVATDGGLHLPAPVTLTCTGVDATAPVLGVMPPVVTIAAPVDVLSGVVHSTVYLSNLGTGTVQIADIRPVDIDTGAAFDWSFTLGGTCSSVNCMLAAGQQVSVDLAFDPSQAALRRALLLVLFHDTIDRTLAIPLIGTGLGATLQLEGTPATLDLGSIPLGKSTSATLHFANTGNRDTTAMLGLAPIGPFSLAPPATLTVTPTAIAGLVETCTPTTAGAVGTTVSATSTDTIVTTTVQVATTCTGITTPLYTMPTGFDFGEVRLDGGPISHAFDVVSNGAPLTLADNPHLDTTNASITVGVPSANSTPATFAVTVMPQAEGDLHSHVTVDDTAGDTLEVPISGRIVSAMSSAQVTVDVGTFCVNQPTTSSNVTLTSTGTATIGVIAPALSAGAPFDLDLVAPTVYPALLPAGKAATVSVRPYRQTGKTMITGTVTWSTDVASQPTTATIVTAEFIDSGGAIAPTSIDFGEVPVHLFLDNSQRVTIQNCSSSLLELEPPTIPAPFSIDSPNFPTQLEPNETATFSVGFHPTRLGAFDDTLTISSPQLVGMPLQVL